MIRSQASASSNPPPKHCPRTAAMVGAGAMTNSSNRDRSRARVSRICPGRCSSILAPKLKWGPSLETMMAFRSVCAASALKLSVNSSIVGRSRMLALGVARMIRAIWPECVVSLRTLGFTGLHLGHFFLCYPRRDLLHEFFAPVRALGQSLPQTHKIHLALVLGSVVECTKPGIGFRHHVQGKPRPAALPVAIPMFEFVLAQAFQCFRQTIRHSVE